MKNLLLLLSVFFWLQACSQSPTPKADEPQLNSILTDTSGVAIGDAPSGGFRLFKSPRQAGDKAVIDLKLLRLHDMKGVLVATLPAEDEFKLVGNYPKFYWSKESKFLITENTINDSIYKRELVIYDLNNMDISKRIKGNLLNFDNVTDMIFQYRQSEDRQMVYYFNPAFPDQANHREVIAAPSGRMPIVTLTPLQRTIRVKAYMPDNVPVNFSFQY